MIRFFLVIFLISLSLGGPAELFAEKVSADQMGQLLKVWPPAGWMLTPPGTDSPYPPYIAAGEFSGTVYRQDQQGRLWSAHVSITDQQSPENALQMLKNYPYCDQTNFHDLPARSCATLGEDLGRQSLIYSAARYLVEISVIGPLPLQLPILDFQLSPSAAQSELKR